MDGWSELLLLVLGSVGTAGFICTISLQRRVGRMAKKLEEHGIYTY
jgi:hypothetical protein